MLSQLCRKWGGDRNHVATDCLNRSVVFVSLTQNGWHFCWHRNKTLYTIVTSLITLNDKRGWEGFTYFACYSIILISALPYWRYRASIVGIHWAWIHMRTCSPCTLWVHYATAQQWSYMIHALDNDLTYYIHYVEFGGRKWYYGVQRMWPMGTCQYPAGQCLKPRTCYYVVSPMNIHGLCQLDQVGTGLA